MDADASTVELYAKVALALQPVPAVRVAYVFGSRARGTSRPGSDLDIAVRLDPATPESERGARVLDILDALGRALGPLGERVDLLDLDRASSTIAFRVIRDGHLVLFRDARERVRLEATVARRYDDERPYRELFRRAARAAAQRMGQPRRDD